MNLRCGSPGDADPQRAHRRPRSPPATRRLQAREDKAQDQHTAVPCGRRGWEVRPSRGPATARRRGAWAWLSPFLHCPQPSASSPESQSPERALRRLSVGVPSWRHRAPGVPLEVPARNRQAWLPRSLSPLCWTYSPPDVTQRSSASGGNEARAPWSTSGAAAPSADRCSGRRKHGRRNASPPESEILKNNRWHLLRRS